MTIYIYRNGQQFGPFEEQVVADHIRSGQFSAEDMGIRQGETEWQKLGTLFPAAAAAPAPFAAIPPPPVVQAEVPAAPAEPVQYEAVYRGTTLQKIFFGLCFLVAVVALGVAGFYLYSFAGSTGDLQADLARLSFRILLRNAAIGIFVGTFFTLLAFVLTFKRKLIRSNGPRIALRVFFILVFLVGLGNIGFGVVSYFTNQSASRLPSTSNNSNELLKVLEEGSAATEPYQLAVIFLPIGGGLLLFGLSGILMTKKLRTE